MRHAMNFWVIGGDQRQAALAKLLEEDGHAVHTFALEGAEGLTCAPSPEEAVRADCVVLPLPASGEGGRLNAPLSEREVALEQVLDCLRPGQLVCAGMVKEPLTALAEERGLILRDYFAREELAVARWPTRCPPRKGPSSSLWRNFPLLCTRPAAWS